MSLDVEVTKKDGKIYVATPYNKDFIKKARELNGEWSRGGKVWVFDENREEALNKSLLDYYAYSATGSEETVTIKIRAVDFETNGEIKVGSVLIAKRWGRDESVKLYNDSFVSEGEFDSSGGSNNNPRVSSDGTVVIVIPDFPKRFLGEIKDGQEYEILDHRPSRSSLIAEKEKLEKRLEEISKLLKEITSEEK